MGCDHAGFPLKEGVTALLRQLGHSVEDLGTDSTAPVDYPDFARAVATAVVSGRCERGIVLFAVAREGLGELRSIGHALRHWSTQEARGRRTRGLPR